MTGDRVVTLLINDFNIASHASAEIQTHALAASKFYYEKKLCTLVIGLPMSLDMISLFVYVAFEGKLSVIEVCSMMNYTGDQLPRLLCVVYAAIIGLAAKPISTIEPELLSLKCCDGEHRVLSEKCVVCTQKRQIVKFYDIVEKPYLKPNEHFYDTGNVELLHLNNRIKILKYNYIEGNHSPRNLRGIIGVLRNLNRIHEKGYVHGDIRAPNLMYGCNSGTIIDYDFASPEGSTYPEFYNSELPERARGAAAYGVMRQLHDRVSLFRSIVATYIYLTDFQYSILDKLHLLKIPLTEIITDLMRDVRYE